MAVRHHLRRRVRSRRVARTRRGAFRQRRSVRRRVPTRRNARTWDLLLVGRRHAPWRMEARRHERMWRAGRSGPRAAGRRIRGRRVCRRCHRLQSSGSAGEPETAVQASRIEGRNVARGRSPLTRRGHRSARRKRNVHWKQITPPQWREPSNSNLRRNSYRRPANLVEGSTQDSEELVLDETSATAPPQRTVPSLHANTNDWRMDVASIRRVALSHGACEGLDRQPQGRPGQSCTSHRRSERHPFVDVFGSYLSGRLWLSSDPCIRSRVVLPAVKLAPSVVSRKSTEQCGTFGVSSFANESCHERTRLGRRRTFGFVATWSRFEFLVSTCASSFRVSSSGELFFLPAAHGTGDGALSMARLAFCDADFVRHACTPWSRVHESHPVASAADEQSASVLAAGTRLGTCHDTFVQVRRSFGSSSLSILLLRTGLPSWRTSTSHHAVHVRLDATHRSFLLLFQPGQTRVCSGIEPEPRLSPPPFPPGIQTHRSRLPLPLHRHGSCASLRERGLEREREKKRTQREGVERGREVDRGARAARLRPAAVGNAREREGPRAIRSDGGRAGDPAEEEAA